MIQQASETPLLNAGMRKGLTGPGTVMIYLPQQGQFSHTNRCIVQYM